MPQTQLLPDADLQDVEWDTRLFWLGGGIEVDVVIKEIISPADMQAELFQRQLRLDPGFEGFPECIGPAVVLRQVKPVLYQGGGVKLVDEFQA